MTTINEKEIRTLRALAKAHIKKIITDTKLLIEYMKTIQEGDIFMTLLTLYGALKFLELEEKREKEDQKA